ncbi:YraN family protein [Candidatus Laterigemmans baculatus]|uniref:YraN family protein n=1 Tax=Candidatus Laterigemmans baculatus TaxID=2770505 RepID=UPI001F42A9EC|nr:YraN family protein [Candidatus Laterigemmans baculatus]
MCGGPSCTSSAIASAKRSASKNAAAAKSLADYLRGLRSRFDRWRFGAIDPAASLGKRGEQAAAILLRRKGYRILAAGETDRGGEIDLIALDRKTLGQPSIVFVEVKTQGTRLPGNPAERVDADKQQRLTRAALRYLKRHKLLEHRARFDVVAVWWTDAGAPEPERIEHYPNAFEATGEGQFYS